MLSNKNRNLNKTGVDNLVCTGLARQEGHLPHGNDELEQMRASKSEIIWRQCRTPFGMRVIDGQGDEV